MPSEQHPTEPIEPVAVGREVRFSIVLRALWRGKVLRAQRVRWPPTAPSTSQTPIACFRHLDATPEEISAKPRLMEALQSAGSSQRSASSPVSRASAATEPP